MNNTLLFGSELCLEYSRRTNLFKRIKVEFEGLLSYYIQMKAFLE